MRADCKVNTIQWQVLVFIIVVCLIGERFLEEVNSLCSLQKWWKFVTRGEASTILLGGQAGSEWTGLQEEGASQLMQYGTPGDMVGVFHRTNVLWMLLFDCRRRLQCFVVDSGGALPFCINFLDVWSCTNKQPLKACALLYRLAVFPSGASHRAALCLWVCEPGYWSCSPWEKDSELLSFCTEHGGFHLKAQRPSSSVGAAASRSPEPRGPAL